MTACYGSVAAFIVRRSENSSRPTGRCRNFGLAGAHTAQGVLLGVYVSARDAKERPQRIHVKGMGLQGVGLGGVRAPSCCPPWLRRAGPGVRRAKTRVEHSRNTRLPGGDSCWATPDGCLEPVPCRSFSPDGRLAASKTAGPVSRSVPKLDGLFFAPYHCVVLIASVEIKKGRRTE